MKVRNGFVSNSSSSSFVIKKEDLSEFQLFMIRNHFDIGKVLDKHIDFYKDDFEDGFSPDTFIYLENRMDEWKITEDDNTISGDTWMNNFSMESFLRLIGVDRDKVNFEEM